MSSLYERIWGLPYKPSHGGEEDAINTARRALLDTTTDGELEALSRSRWAVIRQAVAVAGARGGGRLSAETWARLRDDPVYVVRAAVSAPRPSRVKLICMYECGYETPGELRAIRAAQAHAMWGNKYKNIT